MLNLSYSPDVPKAMIEMLEHYAKRMGMPLSDIEEIGQSLDRVEAFLVEVETAQAALFRDITNATAARAAATVPRRVARS